MMGSLNINNIPNILFEFAVCFLVSVFIFLARGWGWFVFLPFYLLISFYILVYTTLLVKEIIKQIFKK